MAKIRKYYYDFIVLISIFSYFLFRYDVFFMFITTVYAIVLTYYLRRYDNILIQTRYRSIKKYKLSMFNLLTIKSILISLVITLFIAILNLFQSNYIQLNYILIFLMYFCFYSVISIFIFCYRVTLVKTIIILFIFLITLFFKNPVIFFIQILIDNYYWYEPLNIIKAIIIWLSILICGYTLTYSIDEVNIS